MNGHAEWTEMGASSGLDHLAMLAPVEAFYQSLLPGFSSITTRMRNYAFHAWWITRNARTTKITSKKAFQEHTRRVEALYALASAQWGGETGIAGARFALNKLAKEDEILDFRFETSLETPADLRYLSPPAGDFQGTYFGQMREIGLLARAARHDMPVPTKDGERLAEAYEAALPIAPERFFEIAKAGQVSRTELGMMRPMAPSAIDQDGEEARLLREILMGEDGSQTGLARRASLLAILEIARQTDSQPVSENMLRWWWMDHPPDGDHAEAHTAWQHYQVGDMLRVSYENLMNQVILGLEDASEGLFVPELIGDLISDVPDMPLGEWLDQLSASNHSLNDLQDAGRPEGASLDAIMAPIARLWAEWRGRIDELEDSLPTRPGHQTCVTELTWIEHRRHEPASKAMGQLIYERVLRRHLEVAARKFRLQGSYTYLVELEHARLRARSLIDANPSGPRLATAIKFLDDVGLLSKGRLTDRGREYLEAV